MNAQCFCSLVPVAARLLQYAQDMLPLEVLEPDAAASWPADQIAGKISKLNLVRFAQQKNMMDNVLKLPDISRPGVTGQYF